MPGEAEIFGQCLGRVGLPTQYREDFKRLIYSGNSSFGSQGRPRDSTADHKSPLHLLHDLADNRCEASSRLASSGPQKAIAAKERSN